MKRERSNKKVSNDETVTILEVFNALCQYNRVSTSYGEAPWFLSGSISLDYKKK
jgi:hypothetical protein